MTTTTKTRASKESCLEAFNTLQATLPAGKTVTRDSYRKLSGVSEADWEYHFGTFMELKRAAGVAPTRADAKLKSAIAKVSSVSSRASVIKEREEYGEQYLRTDDSRYKTMLVASDLHDKEMDPFVLRVMIDTAKRVQPDNIVLGGDVFDLPEFGRYNVDPREWDAVGRIKYAHANIFKPLREAAPDAQFDLIEGNHECVTPATEILTDKGWVAAGVLNHLDNVASFDLTDHTITYGAPVALAKQSGRTVVSLETTFKKELITENHSVIYNGARTQVRDLPYRIDGRKFTNALTAPVAEPIAIDPEVVRLMVWIITHATINRTEGPYKYWLSFNNMSAKLSRRVRGIASAIKGLKAERTERGVEIEGPALAYLLELITGMEEIPHGTRWINTPDWLDQLPLDYGKIVAKELTAASKQGLFAPQTVYYCGWSHKVGLALQWFMVTRGIPCAYKELPHGEYNLVFNDTGVIEYSRGGRVRRDIHALTAEVVSIQTTNGTLITRVDGKINFTGNCRLVKHLADFSPATRAILGDLHGMTIGDLFGLRDFQINYVAKADLKSYSAAEHNKELQNNYRVYHDNFMVHHFPHARHMGMPGVNGHHHSHVVWPMFNIHQGAYEWHQLGAGHKRSASYCEGERWHNGFALVHIDTVTKSVNIEYVPVTNMAVVGGKWYTREASELI